MYSRNVFMFIVATIAAVVILSAFTGYLYGVSSKQTSYTNATPLHEAFLCDTPNTTEYMPETSTGRYPNESSLVRPLTANQDRARSLLFRCPELETHECTVQGTGTVKSIYKKCTDGRVHEVFCNGTIR